MYTVIRRGKIKPGLIEEVVRIVNEGALPLITSAPGFKAFYLVHAMMTP